MSISVKKTTFSHQATTAVAEKHAACAASLVSAVRCVWDMQVVQ